MKPGDQKVYKFGDSILVEHPKGRMPLEEAVTHAAWIVVLTGVDEEQFVELVHELKRRPIT